MPCPRQDLDLGSDALPAAGSRHRDGLDLRDVPPSVSQMTKHVHLKSADDAVLERGHVEESLRVVRDRVERVGDRREVGGLGRCGELVLGVDVEDGGKVALVRAADDGLRSPGERDPEHVFLLRAPKTPPVVQIQRDPIRRRDIELHGRRVHAAQDPERLGHGAVPDALTTKAGVAADEAQLPTHGLVAPSHAQDCSDLPFGDPYPGPWIRAEQDGASLLG